MFLSTYWNCKPFVGFALQGRDATKHPKRGLFPYSIGSCEVLSRDISDITKGFTWTSPYYANSYVFPI
jgi:hypothetical protein